MADILERAARSALMSRIRGVDTQPEKVVRSVLHRAGFRFRLHVRELEGSPDIVLPRHRTCIFVNGCFWHAHAACAYARIPKTDTQRWTDKLARNVARDRSNRAALRKQGWRVIDIWECGIKDVAQPDLSWLTDAISADAPGWIVWPRRPRKRTRIKVVTGSNRSRSRGSGLPNRA